MSASLATSGGLLGVKTLEITWPLHCYQRHRKGYFWFGLFFTHHWSEITLLKIKVWSLKRLKIIFTWRHQLSRRPFICGPGCSPLNPRQPPNVFLWSYWGAVRPVLSTDHLWYDHLVKILVSGLNRVKVSGQCYSNGSLLNTHKEVLVGLG